MGCGPQSAGHNVRRALRRLNVSENRMGQIRYTDFQTLPGEIFLFLASLRISSALQTLLFGFLFRSFLLPCPFGNVRNIARTEHGRDYSTTHEVAEL
jgi:hypothetical protein